MKSWQEKEHFRILREQRAKAQRRAPHLSIVETIGGFYRVTVHGADDLQDPPANHAVIEISRGKTKEEALARAKEWFQGLEDRTRRAL